MKAASQSVLRLALSHHQAGDLALAERLYRDALGADADNARAHELLGLLAVQTGRPELGCEALTRAVEIDPGNAMAHNRLGVALAATDAPDASIASYRRALVLDPNCAEAHSNLGAALAAAGGNAAAIASYRRALDVNPRLVEARTGLGVALQEQGALDEAIAAFERAVSDAPEDATAHKDLGLALLSAGRFGEGFDEWEWRAREPGVRTRNFPQAAWRGEPLAGAKILLWGEQGVGDQIMLGTVARQVAAEAGAAVIEVEPRLVPLFEKAFPGSEVVAASDPAHPATLTGDIDFQASFGTLCRWRRRARGDFDPRMAYLDVVRESRDGAADPKIGIAWQSRLHGTPQTQRFGRAKTCPLVLWQPILTQPGVTFVSLQYGDVGDAIASIKARRGIDIQVDAGVDQLSSLTALAAQISTLDLVITVSCSAAHLAAAMGVPVWLLVPHVAEWRWRNRGEESLWYPDVRLFRQPAPADWPSVIDDVAAALKQRQALDAPLGAAVG